MSGDSALIGCIDGNVLAVRRGGGEVVLGIGGVEARLSNEAAARLAGLLPSVASTDVSRSVAEPPVRSREKIADLIEAELISVGTVLTMTRHDTTYYATVTVEGTLDIDGHREETPSGAADHLTGTSNNGWRVWSVVDGPRLADLRWMLRARGFLGDDHGYAESTVTVKGSIARRWVEYTLGEGLNPGNRDERAVEEFLSGHDYSESTLNSYRIHLRQWFERCGSEP